ncbi:hypothetical protein THF5H11_11444 [Vibrio jasicida]|nr:hypothetical protein THF5H11_11444 [Vibrio jasicida]
MVITTGIDSVYEGFGQFRVTNGVSRDPARITKSMEKLYIRGQF